MTGRPRPGFVLALVLLAGTFASTLAEMVARQKASGSAVLMSVHDLWRLLSPGSIGALQANIETGLHPWLWDPALTAILAFPAWLLLGLPGFMLLLRFNPRRGQGNIDEDALFLYDRLAERAREEGYGDDGRDPYVLPPRRAEAGEDDGPVQDEEPAAQPARKTPPYPKGDI